MPKRFLATLGMTGLEIGKVTSVKKPGLDIGKVLRLLGMAVKEEALKQSSMLCECFD